jgi:hypothetical protein
MNLVGEAMRQVDAVMNLVDEKVSPVDEAMKAVDETMNKVDEEGRRGASKMSRNLISDR